MTTGKESAFIMGKHLTPLQKEFLIHQYKGNPGIKLSDFCAANSISDGAFKKWLKQYEEQGLDGLARKQGEEMFENFLEWYYAAYPQKEHETRQV